MFTRRSGGEDEVTPYPSQVNMNKLRGEKPKEGLHNSVLIRVA